MKNIAIVGLVIVVIGVGVWLSGDKETFISENEKIAPVALKPVPTPDGQTPTGTAQNEQEWLSAIASGKKLACSLSMAHESGQLVEAQLFVDGKKYRMESDISGVKNSVVSDGQAIYVWVSNSKQGTKTDLTCVDAINAQAPPSEEGTTTYGKSSDEVIQNQPNMQCQTTDVVDIALPSDVVFVDQCALLKQSVERAKKFQGTVPQLPKDKIPGYVPVQ